ncbi:hypothetical protein M6D93_01525 [Jatrophihabitans telluris]|uniref:ABC transporter permease n=1 Tax=Jatrophihabitans telluris TaxID=2038343 RepID=A0ABY4R0L3_9ACTN|nr:hypothetical protein [Jatrophihabitans telluris]UQX88695.1 hypothetical protein M6D93_01525 [Jatrophihabitans telluris]
MRLRIEMFLTAVACLLAVLTAAVPDWIEAAWGVDPDGGNGAVEWLFVIAFGALAVVAAVLSRREWLRTRAVGR